MKCISCKKEHKSVNKYTLWLCDDCRIKIYSDYKKMINRKTDKRSRLYKDI